MLANARPMWRDGHGTIEDIGTMPYEIPRPLILFTGRVGAWARRLVVLLLYALCLHATPGRAAIDAARLVDFVDGAVADAMQRDRLAGVSVSIVGRDGVLLAKGYGISALNPRTAMTADTLCRVGSVSKTIVWIALMQLVEQGKLELSDPINRYLPKPLQVPDEGFAQPIQVWHLMSHTAGFEQTVPGTYDDSVRMARAAAGRPGCILIADTSESDFEQVPAEIIQGYSVMILELLAQIGRSRMPTHVFVQGGVGGLAAAVAGSLAETLGRERPALVVVEPRAAACLMASARVGVPARIGGDLTTVMEMLSCGEASPVAWSILRHRADAFITIDDEAACRTVELLKDCDATGEAVPIDAGPSGAAGLAGLVEISRQSSLRESLKLGPDARVLTFGTEAGEISATH